MKKEEHGVFQLTQKLICYDHTTKKFLLLKATPSVDGVWYKEYGPWDFPGGRVDGQELFSESITREVSEELGDGFVYDILGPVSIEKIGYRSNNGVAIANLALYRSGDIVFDGEHIEYRWETADDVEKSEEYKPWIKQFVKAAAERLKEREYLNDLKRLQADFENYKKRQQESQKELSGYLIEKLVLDLIPVLDNFRMATNHVPESSKSDPWVTGIQYIEKQLEDVLTSHGMQVIEANEGDMFDPRVHEAISQENNGSEDEKEKTSMKVVKVLQKGYKLGERIIRPVKVVVE